MPRPPPPFRRFALGASLCLAACTPQPQPGAGAPSATSEALTWEAEKGPVKVTVELSPGEPRLSDEPRLTLTIEAQDGIEVRPPPFGTSLGGFLIRDFHEPLPEFQEGRRILRQIYRLEPVAVGEQVILPIPVRFEDHRQGRQEGKRHEVVTDPQTVKVTSLLEEDIPRLADLKPAAGPLELPAPPFSLAWWWLLLGGLATLMMLIWLLRSRRARQPVALELTPTEWAYRELQQLLREDPLERNDVKTYYVELTAIVRRYIERSTTIRAPEQTTPEFLHAMQDATGFAPERRRGLRTFLEAADLVKFAAHRPARDAIEESMLRAKEFVGLGGKNIHPAAAAREVNAA